jgi:hypothetical protein
MKNKLFFILNKNLSTTATDTATQRINKINLKNDNTLINYVNRFSTLFLIILKVENKLLFTLFYTDDILDNIQNINIFYIFAKIPNFNIVKLFLNIELEKPIIINAMINDNTKNIIKSIKHLNIKKILLKNITLKIKIVIKIQLRC